MKTSLHTLLYSLIPIYHANATSHRKSICMLHDASAQFKRVQSLKQKLEINAETCLVGGKNPPPWFSVAPMMDWTDNHYRTLARLISKHAWLYTEMVVAETIVHQKNNLDRFLAFSPEQHPIVLQIGGSNLENLAKAAELANLYSYDEINLKLVNLLNVPFLTIMRLFLLVFVNFVVNILSVAAALVEKLLVMVALVHVLCLIQRIGVDDRDSYNELCDFISTVSSRSPTNHFIIHARKALLSGLSPAENRKVPPLKYEYYFALVRDFPELQFTLNGGITCINQVNAAIRQGASGVMVGRAAYNNPWFSLGHVDVAIYGVPYHLRSRRQILEQYQEYADSVIGNYGSNKSNVRQLVKPLLNLFHSEPGNSQWKRTADAALRHCKTVKSFLEETLANLPDHVLDSTIVNSPSNHEQFADVDAILPPPYRSSGQQLAYSKDEEQCQYLL